jgi:hypothetical protein
MQTNAMSTFCPTMLSTEIVTPVMATMYSQINMPSAPINSRFLLPTRSTSQIPGRVMPTLTTLVATLCKKGLPTWEFLKKEVP